MRTDTWLDGRGDKTPYLKMSKNVQARESVIVFFVEN